VENEGVAPDVEAWQDSRRMREGHGPQLEKAAETALELLKKIPRKVTPGRQTRIIIRACRSCRSRAYG